MNLAIEYCKRDVIINNVFKCNLLISKFFSRKLSYVVVFSNIFSSARNIAVKI
jgi:hypothetical protein